MGKKLVIDNHDFLKSLPIFDKKINFIINEESSLVKESYRTFKEVKENEDETCPGNHVIIHDEKSYDNNITEYTIRSIGDIIIDYHGDGSVINTNVEQITCSEKDFYNRRSHDIGKQPSTGEIKGSTIVDYHTKYTTVKEYKLPSFININVFRSEDKDPQHPALDMVINTEFFYDDNKDNTATILLAREIRQRFHKNGDIYDFKRSNMKYGYDITGELLKMDTKAKELFEGDRSDIVPRMKIDDNGDYIVRYVSMDKPYDVHMIETYVLMEDTFILKHISNKDQGIEIDFEWLPEGPENIDVFNDGCYEYISTYVHDGMKCKVCGLINRPTSGDMFGYNVSKKGLSFSKSPYFQNIYSGEADGSYFLTNNLIEWTKLEDDNWSMEYNYVYNQDGILQMQTCTVNNGEPQTISEAETIKLDNGDIVHELFMLADPIDKRNKNCILYIATIMDEDENITAEYRVLIVND